jgi:site-specific DNA recombinase
MKKPHRIGAYLRVSTDRQVQVFEGSLETQKFRMQEFVKLKNFGDSKWGDIVEFYIEEGFSAGSDKRPQYQKLIGDIRKKKIDLILVSDLTRLTRNMGDFCALQRELEKYDAGFFSMKEQFDASTSTGRMMVNLMVTLGQFEREQTAERVAINCHSRAMRGYVNGGRAVLGFARHPERKGVLIVDENEAEMVRTIFDLFLIHGTRAKTILALHEKLIFPKRTIKTNDSGNPVKWTTQTLGNVLNQAAYIGYKEVNKIYKADNQDTLKPWQKYKMVKASWPPIIEESKFWEAQRLLPGSANKLMN